LVRLIFNIIRLLSSASSETLRLLEIFDGSEGFVALVFNDLFGLPICCGDCAFSSAYRGHLEGEEVHIWLNLSFPHFVSLRIENAAVTEEAAREATKDDDFRICDLNDTCTLALSKLGSRHVYDCPRILTMRRVILLD